MSKLGIDLLKTLYLSDVMIKSSAILLTHLATLPCTAAASVMWSVRARITLP